MEEHEIHLGFHYWVWVRKILIYFLGHIFRASP